MPSNTQAPYDRIADQWDEVRSVFRAKEAGYIDLLLQGVPSGAKVLDLGCGTGRPIAEYIASRGYKVVGVDRSRALLEHARRNVPDGLWIEADMATLDLPTDFAAAVYWDALFHVERSLHGPILEKVHRCLLPAGRFTLSCGGSDIDLPAFTAPMFGHEFFYDAYPVKPMTKLFEDVGFDVVLAELVDLPDGGRNKGKLAIIGSKQA